MEFRAARREEIALILSNPSNLSILYWMQAQENCEKGGHEIMHLGCIRTEYEMADAVQTFEGRQAAGCVRSSRSVRRLEDARSTREGRGVPAAGAVLKDFTDTKRCALLRNE